MPGYLLDTNVLITWFGKRPGFGELEKLLRAPETELYTSVVCAAEFLSGCGDGDARAFRKIVDAGEIGIVPFSGLGEAELAAEYRRSLGLKMPDAIVAAAAGTRNLVLLTLDRELAGKAKKKIRVHEV